MVWIEKRIGMLPKETYEFVYLNFLESFRLHNWMNRRFSYLIKGRETELFWYFGPHDLRTSLMILKGTARMDIVILFTQTAIWQQPCWVLDYKGAVPKLLLHTCGSVDLALIFRNTKLKHESSFAYKIIQFETES